MEWRYWLMVSAIGLVLLYLGCLAASNPVLQ